MTNFLNPGFLLLALLFAYNMGTVKDKAKDEWVIRYESDKIFIYDRMVRLGPDHTIRELKGEMMVSCSFDKALGILCSPEKVSLWMGGIKENTVLKKIGANYWTAYDLFSLPWPFKDRDLVSEYTVNISKPGSNADVNIKSLDYLLKEKEGVSRIRKYKASWNIKKLNEKTVWITYTALTDEPPVAPRFMQDPVVDRSVHQNMLNLRKLMEAAK